MSPNQAVTHDLRVDAKAEEQRKGQFDCDQDFEKQDALEQRIKFCKKPYLSVQEQIKQNENQHLRHTLEGYTNSVFYRNLLVDNDNTSEIDWTHEYEPNIEDLLFGKTGLP